mgnify:CR=1 FL=1
MFLRHTPATTVSAHCTGEAVLFIIAAAMEYDAPLVTRDEVIPQYPGVRVVWDSVPPPNGDGEPA